MVSTVNLLLTAVLTGVAAFTSANIDDLFVLTFFFTQTGTNFRHWQVVFGHYVGFTILVIVSAILSIGALAFPRPWIGLLGFLPIGMGITYLIRKRHASNAPEGMRKHIVQTEARSGLSRLFTPQIYAVSMVTIANGGDNVGIFTPLFASSSLSQMIITILVFYVGASLWLYIGNRLAHHPIIAGALERYGGVLIPIILIGLGIYILISSNTLTLLPWSH